MRVRLIMLLGVVLAGCRGDAGRPIAIGDGLPRTDNKASFLPVMMDLLDSVGPPNTRVAKWTLQFEDFDRSEGAQAEVFASDPSVVAVVGHAGSKGTLLAIPTYRAADMPVVVPTSTANALSNAGSNIFMLSPPDGVEGQFIADQALDSLHATRIAVMYVADPYGIGLRDGVVSRLTARGVRLVGDAAVSGKECLSVSPQAIDGIARALIQRSHPDLLILAFGGAQVTCAVPYIRKAAPELMIIAGDSFEPEVPPSRRLTEAERHKMYYVSFWGDRDAPAARAFIARSLRVRGRLPSAGDALNHDGYLVLASAIKSGARTRAAIKAYLQALGTPEHPPIIGATGSISFRGPRRVIMRLELFGTP